MFLLSFSLRRIFRHWRINLLIFSGLVLTGALVAALPAYAQAIAAQGLEKALGAEPAFSRNILLTAGPEVTTFNAALQAVLDDALGFMIVDQLEVREAELDVYRSPDGRPVPDAPADPARLWSFSSLTQDAVLVEGEFPEYLLPLAAATALFDPQPVEAVVGRSTAEEAGLQVGDVIYSAGDGFEFRIVGIVEPRDPADERWFDDLRPFELEIELGLNEDVVTTPLLLNPTSMSTFFPDHQRSWRVVVDQALINPGSARQIEVGIGAAQAGFATFGVDLTSGIPLLLNSYQAQLRTARISLLLLTTQALIFVFYTLGMVTSFMLDRSKTEIAVLSSRGARRSQMMTLFTLEGFFLALPGAALLGPQLTAAALRTWVRISGVPVETDLPAEAWLLSLIAAIIGWASFVLPGYAQTGRGAVEHQQALARPPQKSIWQRRNLDLFLLLVSILAYWQLSQSGSFVMTRVGESGFADPLLLIGPSLLLIAVALIFLRLFPVLMGLIHRFLSRGRGLILPIGLARLARDPIASSRVVLLISLAAGLTFFSITFRDSLELRQKEIAHYLAGADLRVSTRRTPLERIRSVEGIDALSVVYRMRLQGPSGKYLTLLALDPETFSRVARYPEGIGGGYPISQLMDVLGAETPSGSPAAIISRSALPAEMSTGSTIPYQFQQQVVTFEIRGIIEEFPTVSGEFLMIDAAAIDNWQRMAAVNLAQQEAWLSVGLEDIAAIREAFPRRGEILGDYQAQLNIFETNALSEGGKQAFALNAAILGVLSIAGFAIVHYFTAQGRAQEFSILRAGGLSGFQLLFMLVVEGLIVMVLGLTSGTLVGLGLSLVMRSFLSRVFATVLSGAVVERILVDWAAIGQFFGLLAAFYTLALLISVAALLRMGVHRLLRISPE